MDKKEASSETLDFPIVLIVFNRPDLIKEMLSQIKLAQPKKLYVIADAPRVNNEVDKLLCQKVRAIIDAFEFEGEIVECYRSENLGCKKNIETGLDWFFTQEDAGIILEDDCLPSIDFFRFCAEMLIKYRDNPNIFSITGNNFQNSKIRGQGSYYVSKYMHCWGWATWRRAWKFYDGNLSFWPEWKESLEYKKIHSSRVEKKYWDNIFESVFLKKKDSWAYAWLASSWYYGGNTLTPNVNLVSNLGFDSAATNTKLKNGLDGIKTHLMSEKIVDPINLTPDIVADKYVFSNVFRMSVFKRLNNRLLFYLNNFIKHV